MPEADDLFDLRLPAFLVSLQDGPGNRLTLVVAEATHLGDPLGTETATETELEGVLAEILGDARPIVSGPGDRSVEITWFDCVGYSVLNESYAGREIQSPQHDGRAVHVFTESHFLAYLHAATFADDDYPGPVVHHQIVTSHHVVNVVSAHPPKIRSLPPPE